MSYEDGIYVITFFLILFFKMDKINKIKIKDVTQSAKKNISFLLQPITAF